MGHNSPPVPYNHSLYTISLPVTLIISISLYYNGSALKLYLTRNDVSPSLSHCTSSYYTRYMKLIRFYPTNSDLWFCYYRMSDISFERGSLRSRIETQIKTRPSIRYEKPTSFWLSRGKKSVGTFKSEIFAKIRDLNSFTYLNTHIYVLHRLVNNAVPSNWEGGKMVFKLCRIRRTNRLFLVPSSSIHTEYAPRC